jgi:CRISPR-associated endonuclease Csn1
LDFFNIKLNMGKVLGLDLGTNSIGWALVDDAENKILGIGSRIFPEGVADLGQGEKEVSKNASRTDARGTRRQFFRRRLRKRYLLRELAKNSLCPIAFEKVKIWTNNEVFNSTEYSEWIKLNPYLLRAKAINEEISLEELGRIFYHMIQRRGFLSNSRSAGSDDSEKSVIFQGDAKIGKIGISATQENVVESKTLGSYLNQIQPQENEPYQNLERIRNRYTTRQMYVDEFEQIWEKQKGFHPTLTNELKTIIGGRKKDGYNNDGVLFHQRPLRSQKHLVGNCTFEPKKTKCQLSAIPFEEFRVYQWVNTVECNGKKIDRNEREMLVQELLSKQKVKFIALRKVLNKADSQFNFNYKDDDTIVGTHTISHLSNKKFFGTDWFNFTQKEQEDIWHVLYFFEDRDKLKNYAILKWGFEEEKAEKISKFNLKDGYANLSRKAINNILPFLKQGILYDKAVILGGLKNAFADKWSELESKQAFIDSIDDIAQKGKKGGFIADLKNFLIRDYGFSEKQLSKLYHHSAQIEALEILEKLPLGKVADKEIQSIRNPIVTTALFELRKLVNEIIDDFGKPDQIKVEMARDLKISKIKRNEIRKTQKLNEAYNDYIVGRLREHNQIVSYDNILKYKLWEECNKTCPYTGNSISVEQLFSGEVQIEHIMPWSRSLNDSFMNKTLCFADENRAKGDLTPFEFYAKKSEAVWETKKQQALNCFKDKTIDVGRPYRIKAYNKFKQFIRKELPDDFISRQLNDTRYISKEAKNYLGKICKDVQVSPGQMTAKLRYDWGLNEILNDDNSKSRDDHRHHAIDALVMACSTRSHLQKLSDLSKKQQVKTHKLESVPYPKNWKLFRQDAEKAISQILVSHKKTNNILTIRTTKVKKGKQEFTNVGIAARGQLHKETVFGKRTAPHSEEAFHIRKPIDSLTTNKHVDKVVDPVIRNLIIDRVEKLGGFEKGTNIPKETFYVLDENGIAQPQIFLPNKNGNPVPVKKVRLKKILEGLKN